MSLTVSVIHSHFRQETSNPFFKCGPSHWTNSYFRSKFRLRFFSSRLLSISALKLQKNVLSVVRVYSVNSCTKTFFQSSVLCSGLSSVPYSLVVCPQIFFYVLKLLIRNLSLWIRLIWSLLSIRLLRKLLLWISLTWIFLLRVPSSVFSQLVSSIEADKFNDSFVFWVLFEMRCEM